jgi:hypothetical protein
LDNGYSPFENLSDYDEKIAPELFVKLMYLSKYLEDGNDEEKEEAEKIINKFNEKLLSISSLKDDWEYFKNNYELNKNSENYKKYIIPELDKKKKNK